MRIRLLLVAVLVLLLASPAAADITARYVSGFNASMTMVVEVNDRGDSRVSMGNQMAVLTLDGQAYVLTADLAGTYAVKHEDMIAVIAAQGRAMMAEMGHLPTEAAAPEAPRMTAVQQGTETVAGRAGTVWAVLRPGEAGARTDGALQASLEFVVNTDPDLAPVGRVLASQYGASLEGMDRMLGVPFGAGDGGMSAAMRSIFERGTVIRFGRMFRLDSVDANPVPASQFVLPATVLTREQYAARSGFAPPR